jgi:hypothetical protein
VKRPLKNQVAHAALSNLQHELLEKLAYFAVFKHPLRASELQNALRNYYSYERIAQALLHLQSQQLCFCFDGHYSVLNSVKDDLSARLSNEKNAAGYFQKLPFYARLIGAFPFVRGVAVSGSLSKGVIHADGDIDYFIITAHNRLWLTRMLLILFKKVFLFNSRKYFCVNYFVSEKHLEIHDKNLFTATEIVTLLPVYRPEKVKEFIEANPWHHAFYGHFEQPISVKIHPAGKQRLKRFGEWILNNPLGDVLDILSMHITVWRWHIKFKTFSRSKFDLTLRSTRNVSKHHPRDFQTVVLNRQNAIKTAAEQRLDF